VVDDLFNVRDDGTVVLRVHAHPGAGRTAVVGRHGTAVKVRVAAPPVGGRANEAIVRLLAEQFGVVAGDVELVKGDRSADKAFRVSGVEAEEFGRRLETVLDEGATTPGRRDKGGRR
jgi:uncharacterized protein (TIGR00251 family)